MRTKSIALFLPMTFVLALLVYAQTQTGSMGGERSKNMKITGCLQAGSEPNTYVLNNANMSRSRSSRTPSEMARAETSYKLIPEDSVDLKDHVGHKVEVTGTLENQESSMEHSSPSANETPELKVSSIRHISPTCP